MLISSCWTTAGVLFLTATSTCTYRLAQMLIRVYKKMLVWVHEMHGRIHPINFLQLFCLCVTSFHHQPTLWSPTSIPQPAILPIKPLVAKQQLDCHSVLWTLQFPHFSSKLGSLTLLTFCCCNSHERLPFLFNQLNSDFTQLCAVCNCPRVVVSV